MVGAAERIAELLSSDDPPLDRLMAAVASIDPNAPSEELIVSRLDELADAVGTTSSLAELLGQVFGRLGFRGNAANYYDVRNSLIHHVLDRRTGIPLSLSIVASEIGRRRRYDVRPIGMPGHVLLGASASVDLDEWFDPFDSGTRLTRAGCEAIFSSLHPGVEFLDAYLDPMPARTVVARTLENLRVAHLRSGDRSALPPVLGLRAELPGAPPEFRLELATVLASLGRFDAAADERDRLVELVPSRAEHHRIEALRLRSHRN